MVDIASEEGENGINLLMMAMQKGEKKEYPDFQTDGSYYYIQYIAMLFTVESKQQ